MSYRPATVEIIAEQLRWSRDKGYSTAVLLGAGMSVSAGIPLAKGMIEHIKQQFPKLAATCPKETYPAYMSLLAPAQRRQMIGTFVDGAKINLAHLQLGALVKEGYVNRVLTTNFDPLVIRSLALFNIYPAVYDFAASQAFIPGEAAQLSVFYLHGQRDGFALLNTEEEVKTHAEKLGTVFQDVTRGRRWIVIGYSGENDPVFDRLAEIEVFRHKLFWIGYQDEEPRPHVLQHILQPEKKYGRYVKGHDADSFFLALARQLDLPEPQIISKPFSHLKEMTTAIAEFPVGDRLTDVTSEAKRWIDMAIEGFEEGKGFEGIEAAEKSRIGDDELVRRARNVWVQAQFDEIDNILEAIGTREILEAEWFLALALDAWGGTFLERAQKEVGQQSEGLFNQAIEKFERALEIQAENPRILSNMATALEGFAQTKDGQQAEGLIMQALEKRERVAEILPDSSVALRSWGTALSDLGQLKEGQEAEQLFEQAIQKYEGVLEIQPDNWEALNNLGLALIGVARLKEGSDREELLRQALDKCMKVEEIEKGRGAYNIACVYSLMGEVEDALRWLEKALTARSDLSKEHILKDSDLDNIRRADAFRKLLDHYRPE